MSFEAALAFTLGWEGGYANDPQDKGGPTNHGITQATYDTWQKAHGLVPQGVKAISKEEVAAIYREGYWDAAGCNGLDDLVALVVFDAAVNHGVKRSSRWLQKCVMVTQDGVVGPQTLKAANNVEPVALATALLDLRQDFYNDIVENSPSQGKFLNGWLNRVAALRKEIRHGN